MAGIRLEVGGTGENGGGGFFETAGIAAVVPAQVGVGRGAYQMIEEARAAPEPGWEGPKRPYHDAYESRTGDARYLLLFGAATPADYYLLGGMVGAAKRCGHPSLLTPCSEMLSTDEDSPRAAAAYPRPEQAAPLAEYITIEAAIQRGGREDLVDLTEKKATRAMLQVCEAAQTLHNHGVVGIGLSPSDILYDQRAGRAYVFAAGSARMAVADGEPLPTVADDVREAGAAYGALLDALHGEGSADARAVRSAMEEGRCASMGAVVADLRRILDGASVSVRRAPALERFTMWRRREPGKFRLAATAALTGLAFVFSTGAFAHGMGENRDLRQAIAERDALQADFDRLDSFTYSGFESAGKAVRAVMQGLEQYRESEPVLYAIWSDVIRPLYYMTNHYEDVIAAHIETARFNAEFLGEAIEHLEAYVGLLDATRWIYVMLADDAYDVEICRGSVEILRAMADRDDLISMIGDEDVRDHLLDLAQRAEQELERRHGDDEGNGAQRRAPFITVGHKSPPVPR